MSILEITLKLFLALALGGLIGIERESSQKPAGFRTNILICVGSTLMVIFSQLVLQGTEGGSGDLTRMAAGVITGIGFIGAGTIIQSRGSVVGLTTAATLWAVGGLGLVIGAGYYLIAIIFTSIVILTLVVFRYFESFGEKVSLYRYLVKTKPSRDILMNIKKFALHEGIKFKEITLTREDDYSTIFLSFSSPEEKERKFSQSLLNIDGIIEMKIE